MISGMISGIRDQEDVRDGLAEGERGWPMGSGTSGWIQILQAFTFP